ncbi:hypothetical protein ASPVEDRAFT_136407 [Aspergillus versicolor CBS 583.65]|uniref:Cytochrome P450 n=1 Tax=Aspergillus versicolor CBS 583.65 TaxID=1036611 RepID=A0A1L9PQW4_ASPVE|nr:uncharacterized protein ASPVEDRAFT_136407 [Aspergillus versicolor CBS 583.65]OJJ03893.1 hypothetical protein ASPVEDRAFT_136407 [Aspergillus versicolor CBS 583.65]
MHIGVFLHGEWHSKAPAIVVSHSVAFLSCLAFIPAFALPLTAGYLVALFSSIAIYRAFFHRLHSFPGPFWARTTKLWHLWKSRSSQNHFLLADLRQEYGEFVRTGPSEITVFHPHVFSAVDGPSSKCGKAEWYDLLYPFTKSLVTSRTKEMHTIRRLVWKQGFTSKALRDGKDQTLSLIKQLDNCIQADIRTGRVSELSDFVYWFSFDRMASYVLGHSFNMLLEQQWHYIIVLLQRALSILGPLSPTPWLVQLAFRLGPRVWVIHDWFTMMEWCGGQLKQYKPATEACKSPSLAHYLLEDIRENPVHESWLAGDSLLAFVAGSEPTAGVLIGLFYELAKNPAQAEAIHREITQHEENDVLQCRHLKAVVYEALRLYPSLPTGGNRKTPRDEGITIAGVYIPPQTTIVAPKYAIGRSEICFESPNEFIPERWTTRPEMIRDRAGFAPFGGGAHSCLGRALALNDMLLVTAHVVRRYRMRFPPGETGDHVFLDWRDRFTSKLGQLRLVFQPREPEVEV